MKTTSPTFEQVFRLFFKPDEVSEIRGIGFHGKGPWNGYARGVVAGYFDNGSDFARAARALDEHESEEDRNVYFLLNPCYPSLLGRANNKLRAIKATTKDKEILFYRWLPIDTDPRRPAEISATDEEVKLALECRDAATGWLSAHNWPEPIKGASGNGAHALYLLPDLPNNSEIEGIIKQILMALNSQFGRDGAIIDKAVFNPARIFKLYGTTARKGDPTYQLRPHRRSYLEAIPSSIIAVPLEKLKWVAAQAPKEKLSKPNIYIYKNKTDKLDVAAYLKHYGVEIIKTKQVGESTLFCLRECIFDPLHFSNEASIGQQEDGKLFYQCFHDSCKGRTWSEAREKISGTESLEDFCGANKTEVQPKEWPLPVGAGDPQFSVEVNLTDLGNARRFVTLHGKNLRYCHPWGKWLIWKGSRWSIDNTGEVERQAKDTIRGIYQEASETSDGKLRRALVKHGLRTESEARIRAMIELAKTEQGIPILPDEMDQDPWALNVKNGTIDLTTGKLRPHVREDRNTKISPVEFHVHGECPLWIEHLRRIFSGNEQMISFLQLALGYSLTGVTDERVLFISHGSGANGKTTTHEVIAQILGEYATRTPTETILVKREGAIPNDLAKLRGSRFVFCSEVEEGKRLAESQIKDLTGGDTIAARFMRGEWFEFQPKFKIWLATNHKPVIRGTDNAIWDRIRLIPYTVSIPPAERIPQSRMMGKLTPELPGILSWLIRGCLDWRRYGLEAPQEVKTATVEYRADMDILGRFLNDCCVVSPKSQAAAKELYQTYVKWAEGNGEHSVSQRMFGTRLGERGFIRNRKAGDGKVIWHGIGLLRP